jgi:sulfoxide reductase heme-binding subunit YedZ
MASSICEGISEVSEPVATPKVRAKFAWLEQGVLIGALVPLGVIAQAVVRGTLGADPVAIVLNKLGLLALILLFGSLAATPLKIVFGVTWPIRIRRLLGLLAFFYASLHFLTYLGVDQGFALGAIARDVLQRRFITVGFAALCLLVPLAITSTSGMLKRLGARRWKRLHRIVYLAAGLAAVHFVWRVKRDLSEPLVYAALLALLLCVRIFERRRRST